MTELATVAVEYQGRRYEMQVSEAQLCQWVDTIEGPPMGGFRTFQPGDRHLALRLRDVRDQVVRDIEETA